MHALTGIRFFAALHVVLFHTMEQLPVARSGWFGNVIGAGYVSVSLFFVLSGFILAYTYVDARGTTPIRRRAFWVARLARVYPVYLLGLAVAGGSLIKLALRNGLDVEGLLATGGIAAAVLALVQAWVPPAACVWNCPGWSLSAEAFFYAVFPLLAIPVARAARRHFALVGAALWLAALAAPLAYLAIDPDGIGGGSPALHPFWLSVVIFNPLLRLPEFLLGVACGAYYTRAAEHAQPERDRAGGLTGWLAVAALVGTLVVLVASPRIPYVLLHNGLLAPLFALAVVSLATGEGPLARALAAGPLVRLGEASYALYILHIPLWSWAKLGAAAVGSSGERSGTFVVGFTLVCVLVSIVVYQRVELPARNYLRDRLAPRESTGALHPPLSQQLP